MEVFANLFDDLVGILSISVVAIVILIAIFFIFYFVGKAKEEPGQE